MLRIVGLVLVSMGVVYLIEALVGEPIFPWRRWRWNLVLSQGLSPRRWFLIQGGVMIVLGVALMIWGA